MSNSLQFQTFVFIDTEATGTGEDRPKIMEICLIAVHRYSVVNTLLDHRRLPQMPRIVDKLCLCMNPKKLVSQRAVELTGLSNENMTENQKQGFDDTTVTLLNAFLKKQTPPICLVAHFGLKYDFPLLKTELLRLNADLAGTIYCLDTYQALKEIYEKCGPKPKRKGQYKLSELYRHYFKEYPAVTHGAEADVVTLACVFLCCSQQLLEWASLNSRSWEDIRPMYKPSPSKPEISHATPHYMRSSKTLVFS
ncbi:three prime repair exonuclease 2 [Protopterus annectens]|uniref:three prime repair exonuclease 2 n=1 Tax=Protopterus annectens TaxID=7888 RepID=UPI001CFA5375|nr:three prime repair exonuclease 2 [Protopterus annectens]